MEARMKELPNQAPPLRPPEPGDLQELPASKTLPALRPGAYEDVRVQSA